MTEPGWRPSREQVAAARGRTVPDVIRPGLQVLFVGINPGLYSGAVGHHFARPGNRFWRTLHQAGFTDRMLSPFEERELLGAGIGITNLVERATARADELSDQELRAGAVALEAKVLRDHPRFVSFLGMTAYRAAFQDPAAGVGLRPDRWAGARIWLLPNPSGLNAHYRPADLTRVFGELREAIDRA